jgi:hypothetical protein
VFCLRYGQVNGNEHTMSMVLNFTSDVPRLALCLLPNR